MEPKTQLFNLLDKKTKKKWKKFSKYFVNDSKSFANKILRDYTKKSYAQHQNDFPVHVLKQIKKIDKTKYDSAVCILRGALPYAILFEVEGWKIHYVICGRKNEKFVKNKFQLRFNKSIDKTLKQVKGKKVLLIENNSFTGNTPYRTFLELKKSFSIKKPDLFLDYLVMHGRNNPFKENEKRLGYFGKIYLASKLKVSKRERTNLIEEFLKKLT